MSKRATKPIYPEIIADTLPPEYFAKIGEIIFVWARLEYQLGVLIREGYLIDKDTGRALTIGMDIGVACGVLRTLTYTNHWVEDKAVIKELRELVTDIKDKTEHRHQFAHVVVGCSENNYEEFSRYLFKAAEHRINPGHEIVTLNSLQIFVEEVRGFLRRAIDLTGQLKTLKRKHE